MIENQPTQYSRKETWGNVKESETLKHLRAGENVLLEQELKCWTACAEPWKRSFILCLLEQTPTNINTAERTDGEPKTRLKGRMFRDFKIGKSCTMMEDFTDCCLCVLGGGK